MYKKSLRIICTWCVWMSYNRRHCICQFSVLSNLIARYRPPCLRYHLLFFLQVHIPYVTKLLNFGRNRSTVKVRKKSISQVSLVSSAFICFFVCLFVCPLDIGRTAWDIISIFFLQVYIPHRTKPNDFGRNRSKVKVTTKCRKSKNSLSLTWGEISKIHISVKT